MTQRLYPRDPIPALKQRVAELLGPLLEGWNADDVAAIIGTDRPRVSEIRRGELERFSLETLIRYLARLDHDVELHVTPRRPRYKRNYDSRRQRDTPD